VGIITKNKKHSNNLLFLLLYFYCRGELYPTTNTKAEAQNEQTLDICHDAGHNNNNNKGCWVAGFGDCQKR